MFNYLHGSNFIVIPVSTDRDVNILYWSCWIVLGFCKSSHKYGLGVSIDCFPCHHASNRWQQLNYYTLLATYSPLSGQEKTRETRNDF